MFLNLVQNFANKKKIKDLKIKRLKARDNLRKLRRLNDYYLRSKLSSRIGISDYTTFLVNYHESALLIKSSSFNNFSAVLVSNGYEVRSWKSNIYRYIYESIIRVPTLSCQFIKNNHNYNFINFWIMYYTGFKTAKINRKSMTLNNSVDKVLILNNKRTQFYLTHLSYNVMGWSTDVSAYPGVIAALFGNNDKPTRSKFKKKDKNILKALNRAMSLVLFSFLVKSKGSSGLALSIKKKPRSLEFYDMFIRSLVSVYRIKIPVVVSYPSVRHSFIKLRKYARVKRRSRKVITKSSSSLNTSNLSKFYQVDNASLRYAKYRV